MGAFLYGVLSLPGLCVVLAAGLLLSVWRPRRPWKRFLTLVTALYLCAAIWIVPAAIARLVLGRYPQLQRPPEQPIAIVLLSGGSDIVTDWNGKRFGVMATTEAERVLEAARLYHASPDAVIISSGDTWSPSGEPTNAVLMRDALVSLGVPAGRILLEEHSQDTHQQAVLVAPMLRTMPARTPVLVTSGSHLRRALGVFRAAGVDAVAAPSHDRDLDLGWWDRVTPTDYGVGKSAEVTHEVVGLIYYKARGWM
jgi:uncharacterized SAM-binding protein YcdF (DUF218 family)